MIEGGPRRKTDPATTIVGPWARRLRRRLARAGMTTPDQVFGLAWFGAMLSSLLVGYWEGKGKARRLVFAGKLGTGFTVATQRDLLARLDKFGPRAAPPFESVPRERLKNAVWVEPRLVVEGQFRG